MNHIFMESLNSTSTYVLRYTPNFPLSDLPMIIWNFYLDYFWLYHPNSWVAWIANACRLFAVLVAFPTIVLGLLDIASYAIARTLGVIDEVKASTSDKAINHSPHLSQPTIHIQDVDSSSTDSERDTPTDHSTHNTGLKLDYFASGESSDLKLSGVGVFSPVGSQPASPTISRKHFGDLGEESMASISETTLPRSTELEGTLHHRKIAEGGGSNED